MCDGPNEHRKVQEKTPLESMKEKSQIYQNHKELKRDCFSLIMTYETISEQ